MMIPLLAVMAPGDVEEHTRKIYLAVCNKLEFGETCRPVHPGRGDEGASG
jgi:hypothetical protein